MNALTSITAGLDAATVATVHRLAPAGGITDAEFAAEAIKQIVASGGDYRAFMQVGVDAADRGDLLTQADMERWFEDRVAARRRR